MFQIKAEKVYSTTTFTVEDRQEAIGMAYDMYIEKWAPTVIVTDLETGEIIYRKA